MTVTLNEERQRFELEVEGDTAVMEFRRGDGVIILSHTEVPAKHEGGGVGSRLAKHALEYAREQNLLVVPTCPFVIAYLRRHPEYQDLVRSR